MNPAKPYVSLKEAAKLAKGNASGAARAEIENLVRTKPPQLTPLNGPDGSRVISLVELQRIYKHIKLPAVPPSDKDKTTRQSEPDAEPRENWFPTAKQLLQIYSLPEVDRVREVKRLILIHPHLAPWFAERPPPPPPRRRAAGASPTPPPPRTPPRRPVQPAPPPPTRPIFQERRWLLIAGVVLTVFILRNIGPAAWTSTVAPGIAQPRPGPTAQQVAPAPRPHNPYSTAELESREQQQHRLVQAPKRPYGAAPTTQPDVPDQSATYDPCNPAWIPDHFYLDKRTCTILPTDS